jgi:hypothetical protein
MLRHPNLRSAMRLESCRRTIGGTSGFHSYASSRWRVERPPPFGSRPGHNEACRALGLEAANYGNYEYWPPSRERISRPTRAQIKSTQRTRPPQERQPGQRPATPRRPRQPHPDKSTLAGRPSRLGTQTPRRRMTPKIQIRVRALLLKNVKTLKPRRPRRKLSALHAFALRP